MYPRMAREAKEEGFAEIAFLFESIGAIEKHHKERYQRLLEELESGTHFKKDEKVSWKCRECGHIHEGTEALKICPVCKHPQAYFEMI
jgi:rubrerythrin